jgi:hypothetical protein
MWQKNLFWIVLTPKHIIRIPKPFELGILFGSVPERILEYADTHDPELIKGMESAIVNGSMPGFMPNFLGPIIENITNYSFFLNRPIISQSTEALPPEAQANTYTSEVAKFIGQTLKYSPAKIDNLIQGYTGGLGRYIVSGIDKILKGTGIVHAPVEPTPNVEDLPVIKAFMIRPPVGSGSESVNRIYNMWEKTTGESRYVKQLVESGRPEDATAYIKAHPEVIYAKSLNSLVLEWSQINKSRDLVRASKTMSAEAKKKSLDDLDQLQTTTAQRMLNIINAK